MARASRKNRSRLARSGVREPINLIAAARSRTVSWPRKTSPMPPRPSGRTIWNSSRSLILPPLARADRVALQLRHERAKRHRDQIRGLVLHTASCRERRDHALALELADLLVD